MYSSLLTYVQNLELRAINIVTCKSLVTTFLVDFWIRLKYFFVGIACVYVRIKNFVLWNKVNTSFTRVLR